MKTLVKVLAIVIVLVLVFSFSMTLDNTEEQIQDSSKVFQGPVPEGYDKEHFRKTGETISKKVIGN